MSLVSYTLRFTNLQSQSNFIPGIVVDLFQQLSKILGLQKSENWSITQSHNAKAQLVKIHCTINLNHFHHIHFSLHWKSRQNTKKKSHLLRTGFSASSAINNKHWRNWVCFWKTKGHYKYYHLFSLPALISGFSQMAWSTNISVKKGSEVASFAEP